jgi:hypothetical protein
MAEKKGLSRAEEKFFDALNDSYDALLGAIEAGSERGYRVSKDFVEEARKAARGCGPGRSWWRRSPTWSFYGRW